MHTPYAVGPAAARTGRRAMLGAALERLAAQRSSPSALITYAVWHRRVSGVDTDGPGSRG